MTAPHRLSGLGFACESAGAHAGAQAVALARSQLDAEPGFALLFCGGKHDPDAVLQGARSVCGQIPIVGGSAVGLISASKAMQTGFECGALLLAGALSPQTIVRVAGLDHDEHKTGHQLGVELRAHGVTPDAVVLLFYDSVRNAAPLVINAGSRLLEGLHQGLGEVVPTLVGAGLLCDLVWSCSHIFDGEQVSKQAVVAVVMPSMLTCHQAVTHGCYPASDFMTITALAGARILELDGQPALDVAAARLGRSRDALAAINPALLALTIGEQRAAPFTPFRDQDYVNRLVMAADADSGALIITEADFDIGSRVQLMAVDPQRMIDSAQTQAQAILNALGDQQPLFALYIDCAGRSMVFTGLDEDESEPIRTLIGARCPLLGFFSGVEIAAIAGQARPLDWTGVILIFFVK